MNKSTYLLACCNIKLVKILLSGKFYKDGGGSNYDEVKDGELVHLLAHAGLPTLSVERSTYLTLENTQHGMSCSQEQTSLGISDPRAGSYQSCTGCCMWTQEKASQSKGGGCNHRCRVPLYIWWSGTRERRAGPQCWSSAWTRTCEDTRKGGVAKGLNQCIQLSLVVEYGFQRGFYLPSTDSLTSGRSLCWCLTSQHYCFGINVKARTSDFVGGCITFIKLFKSADPQRHLMRVKRISKAGE